MRKEYTKKEIERILKQKLDISDEVQDKIHAAYDELGIDGKVTMRYTKRHRAWAAAAVAAALLVGSSTVALAATQILSGAWVEKDKTVQYDFKVDNKKEAHAIKVEPTYMPEGYVLQDENTPYGGKWRNQSTGGDISIHHFNAAELYRMEQTGDSAFKQYTKAKRDKNISINGTKAEMFVSDDFYIDSGRQIKEIYLANEENGYLVWVYSDTDLSSEELMKLVKGLKVTVLDTVVPYVTKEEIAKEEEIAKDKEDPNAKEEESKVYTAGVPSSAVVGIGNEVRDPGYEKYKNDPEYVKDADDVGFTVESVQVKDSLSLDEYPAANFSDYDNEVAPWLNADGTLKPHDRYKSVIDEKGNISEDETLDKVNSKFVVAKIKAKNYSDTQSKMNQELGIEMFPQLRTLIPKKDGGYAYPNCMYRSANESYSLETDNFPIYFDKIYYTDGIRRIKDMLFRPLAAGEELEYTMIFVVDDDQLDNMYLNFFSSYGISNGVMVPYVKISK